MLSLTNTQERWGLIAQALHWATALCVFGATAVIWYIVNQDFAHFKEHSTIVFRAGIRWHKALGFVALGLVILRLMWRLRDPRPALPPTMRPWELRLSRVTHAALYLGLLVACMAGWGQVSSNGSVATIFDLVTLPPLVPKSERLHAVFEAIHYWGSWSLVALAVAHAAAALKHHYLDRDRVLVSMLPGPARSVRG